MQSESKKSRRVHGSRNRLPEQSHQHGLNQASENSQLLNSKNSNSENRNSKNRNSKLKPISEHKIQRIEEHDKNGRHNFPEQSHQLDHDANEGDETSIDSKFHRSIECKSIMVELNQAGLRPCQIKKAVNAMKPTNEADVTSKQCADVLSEQRKQHRGREFCGLINHFQDKALLDNDQYFIVDLCSDGPFSLHPLHRRPLPSHLRIPSLSRRHPPTAAPASCSDILHGDEELDDLSDSSTSSLDDLSDSSDLAIGPSHIAHTDKAISNAIKKVFPNSRHRFCTWHIKKHELEHIRTYVTSYIDFQESYRKWVKSDTIEEFEATWDVIRGKYKVENTSWLSDMYTQRTHWVTAFLKDIFWAGMTTSGRSESIHAFFDGFVNSRTMLNEFVIQYDKAVESRRASEEDEYFKTMTWKKRP
ncbi:hypothetical protein LXL04_017133 [Taraxacum kok-saghyz]